MMMTMTLELVKICESCQGSVVTQCQQVTGPECAVSLMNSNCRCTAIYILHSAIYSVHVRNPSPTATLARHFAITDRFSPTPSSVWDSIIGSFGSGNRHP